MAIVFLDPMAKAVLILHLLVLVPAFTSLSLGVPKSEEQQTKENSTKDLIAATSYVYSRNDNGRERFDRLAPARFRNIHGLNTGLNFPRLSRRFHFPVNTYRAGSIGGVGSGIDTELIGTSDGLGKKTLGSRISRLNSDDIADSLSYVGLDHFRPSAFHRDAHDESHYLPGLDGPHYHEHEHDKEDREEEGSKSNQIEESSGEEETSKAYKAAEEFEKEGRRKDERAEESGSEGEEAGVKKAHEDSERKYEETDESVHAANGQHLSHNEGQRKGHKTTGYHNVYHKDEYKKDTTFYDDEHTDAGHQHYSHEDEKHARESGEHKRGEKLDAAYEHGERDRKGFFTNGHQYGVAQGDEREEGQREYEEREREGLSEARHKSSSELAEASHSHY